MFPSEYDVGGDLRNIGRWLRGNEERWRLDEKRPWQTGLDYKALPGLLKQAPIETPGMELPGVADPMTPNLLNPSLLDLDPRNFLVMEQERREREELEATENEKERLRGLEERY